VNQGVRKDEGLFETEVDTPMESETEDKTQDPAFGATDRTDDRLWALIEETGDGVYQTDHDGNLSSFSNSFCKVLGYPREEIQNQNLAKFMDSREARKFNEAISKVWVNHQGFSNLLWQTRDKEGKQRIIELSAYLIENHAGRKIGFRGIARDVTQKFETISALEEAEIRYKLAFEEGRRAKRRTRNLLDFVPYPMVVFSSAGVVTYVNPAFSVVFGWSPEEVIGRTIRWIPPGLSAQTREDFGQLLRGKDSIIETRRMTKDGRILDVIIRGQISAEGENDGFGAILILRDVTEERRIERINEALFQVSKALPQYLALEDLLDYISSEVKRLLNTEAATVGLFDEQKNDFYFPGAAYDSPSAQRQMKRVRYPVPKSASGRVLKTGEAVIVSDTSKASGFYTGLDETIGFHTRNLLIVPLRAKERIIGVLTAINKNMGPFDEKDQKLLTMMASTVALSVENARFSKALREAYDEVSSLNRAKDKVINHLSHELKTPVSILLVSLNQFSKKLEAVPGTEWHATYERAKRNLDRIMEIQYQVRDIMSGNEYATYSMVQFLIDQCADELEALVAEKVGEGEIVRWLRERIEKEFGPKLNHREDIHLEDFVQQRIEVLKPAFSHRRIEIMKDFKQTPSISMPPSVMKKIVDGLIKNAVENTPDGGRIALSVYEKGGGAELMVKDFGVGITTEDQKRIFEGFFHTQETLSYSSRRPFDFDAGGKGADLLRMRVFSERYGFQLRMESTRCRFIQQEGHACPGNIDDCQPCKRGSDCYSSGGTAFVVLFPPDPPNAPQCLHRLHKSSSPS
jgi:PAS domain S-box-containing protein